MAFSCYTAIATVRRTYQPSLVHLFIFWLSTSPLSVMQIIVSLSMFVILTAECACRKPGSWLKLNLFHTKESDAYTSGDSQNGNKNGHAEGPVYAAVHHATQQSNSNRSGIWTNVCYACKSCILTNAISTALKPLMTNYWSTWSFKLVWLSRTRSLLKVLSHTL